LFAGYIFEKERDTRDITMKNEAVQKELRLCKCFLTVYRERYGGYMRKKTLLFGVVLVLSMMVFAGCGNMNNSATDNTQESPEATHADLRDNDTDNNSAASPSVDNDDANDNGIEQGVDDTVDGAEDAVDDVIDGTEDAVDDAADALDGDDDTTTNNKNKN
jgi:hypothetical protein